MNQMTMQVIKEISYFKAPITNVKPLGRTTLEYLYKEIASTIHKDITEQCRTITDKEQRTKFKAASFCYITPNGVFAYRKHSAFIRPSGYVVIDFDNVTDIERLKKRLLNDPI